ncbi:DUF6410 domain-containing protein [Streptomyces sp. NPDC050418]|uniref:DUF6410 domain-containing protein n=1 Tax=Streptomyces sp. NPDC050418 TaxID=3365612 RepID=UPI00378A6D90
MSAPVRTLVIGRDAGPAGRAVRVLAGAAALTHILTTKIPDHSTAEVLAAVGTALVLAAAYTALLAAVRPLLTRGARRGLSGWPGGALFLLPMLLYPIGVLPEAPALGVALYVECSLLIAGLSGYGGIELAALPALILRQRPLLYGPFTAVDLAERAMRRRRHAAPERLAGALAVAGLGWFWVVGPLASVSGGAGDVFDALSGLDPVAGGAVFAAGVLFAVPAAGPSGLRRLSAAAFVLLGLGGIAGAVPDVLWPVTILTGLVIALVRLKSPARAERAPHRRPRAHVETSSTTR